MKSKGNSCWDVLNDILWPKKSPTTETLQRLEEADRKLQKTAESLQETVDDLKSVRAIICIMKEHGT